MASPHSHGQPETRAVSRGTAGRAAKRAPTAAGPVWTRARKLSRSSIERASRGTGGALGPPLRYLQPKSTANPSKPRLLDTTRADRARPALAPPKPFLRILRWRRLSPRRAPDVAGACSPAGPAFRRASQRDVRPQDLARAYRIEALFPGAAPRPTMLDALLTNPWRDARS